MPQNTNAIFFKRSAIHNLIITRCRQKTRSNEINEGLVVPKDILEKCDILPWEQVIVTKINGNNWINRIKTFVIEGSPDGHVEARGSLSRFLREGDVTCLITRTILDQNEVAQYKKNKFPIFDLGFDPLSNEDNLKKSRLDLEFHDRKFIDATSFEKEKKMRSPYKRLMLASAILNLKINKTHPDCLQGSAELPKMIMQKALVEKYQSVSVYNVTKGGIADTYAVPMPPKIVMTTGAMAKFAKIGDVVNVLTFSVSSGKKMNNPTIVSTDGSAFKARLKIVL